MACEMCDLRTTCNGKPTTKGKPSSGVCFNKLLEADKIIHLRFGKLILGELIKLSIRADKPNRSLEIVWTKGELPEVDEAYKDFGGNDSIWEESQLAMLKPPYNYHQVVGEEK